jgi:hypothetical protein
MAHVRGDACQARRSAFRLHFVACPAVTRQRLLAYREALSIQPHQRILRISTTRPSREFSATSNRCPRRHPRYTKKRPRQSTRRMSRKPRCRKSRSPCEQVMDLPRFRLEPIVMLISTWGAAGAGIDVNRTNTRNILAVIECPMIGSSVYHKDHPAACNNLSMSWSMHPASLGRNAKLLDFRHMSDPERMIYIEARQGPKRWRKQWKVFAVARFSAPLLQAGQACPAGVYLLLHTMSVNGTDFAMVLSLRPTVA